MSEICGLCQNQFETEAGYLVHTCSLTESTPVQKEHMDKSKEMSEALHQEALEHQDELSIKQ